MLATACSCRCCSSHGSTMGARCWACSYRSTRATTGSSSTRSPTSCVISRSSTTSPRSSSSSRRRRVPERAFPATRASSWWSWPTRSVRARRTAPPRTPRQSPSSASSGVCPGSQGGGRARWTTSDPVDPPQDGEDGEGEGDDRPRHQPEADRLGSREGRTRLAHPEDPGERAQAGKDHRDPGQPFHDQRQVVVHRREVDVEGARDQLAVRVVLLGEVDRVVVDVAEVDDVVLSLIHISEPTRPY